MATWEFSTILGEEIQTAFGWTIITFFLGIGFPILRKYIRKYFAIVSVVNGILSVITIAKAFQVHPDIVGFGEFVIMLLAFMVVTYTGEAIGATIGASVKKLLQKFM